ncbi:unnamed protein product [Phytomonas sp. Hart1]|nr:unnamed protein product [Phytomonas sp. Hart1]|eukprot:CCW71765.1 unnamed protein product [Phytomonas sp. isolate Hart1]
MGLKAGTKCKRLRRLVPTLCVPDPFAPASPTGEPDMVALQLPKHAKALLFSNVDSYSGGTHPWSANTGLYYRPVELRGDHIVRPEAAPARRPAAIPVNINDGKLEVQAMGGVFDYGFLSVGMTGATKIIQSSEMFAFVGCTPNDLCPPDPASPGGARNHVQPPSTLNLDPSEGKAHSPVKLWIQVDGEAVFPLTEPTIVHIQPIRERRLYVRCRNALLLQNPT